MTHAPIRLLALLMGLATPALAQDAADTEEWIPLFNGRDLDGWTPKIRGFPTGENYAATFRAVDGALTVAYDGYTEFEERFGHVFYAHPYSHYRVRFEYRFFGGQAPEAPGWAFRNSGIMLHSQDPATMGLEQDFPISIEFQLLGGKGNGKARSTGNMCSPGTEVSIDGSRAFWHCMDATSPTFDGDQWVKAEALVLGSERAVHYINGQQVIEYTDIEVGGGMVSGHDPAAKHDGTPLASGWLSLQSEGHPIQFRHIELLDLKGCMDPKARNYKRYFVADDRTRCAY
jgi:hypothetical protein